MSLVMRINEAWKTNMGLLDIFDISKAFSGQIFCNIYFILQMVLSFIFIIFCQLSEWLLIHNHSLVYVSVWENLSDVTVAKFCKTTNKK